MAKAVANNGRKDETPFHRTDGEREQHLNIISKYYLRGYTMRRLVEIINRESTRTTSLRTVFVDIKDLVAEWREARVNNVDELKQIEVQKINEIERAAWEGWETSLRLQKKATRVTREPNNKSGNPEVDELELAFDEMKLVRQEVYTSDDETAGNPAFLKIVLDCINRRCALFGLDAAPLQDKNPGQITIVHLPDNGRTLKLPENPKK